MENKILINNNGCEEYLSVRNFGQHKIIELYKFFGEGELSAEVFARMASVLEGYKSNEVWNNGPREERTQKFVATKEGVKGFLKRRVQLTWGDGREEVVDGCKKLLEMGLGLPVDKEGNGWQPVTLGYLQRGISQWKNPRKMVMRDGRTVTIKRLMVEV